MNVADAASRMLRRSLRLATPFIWPEAPVLNYHSVDNAGSLLSISTAALAAQLAHLQHQGWRSLSIAEYLGATPQTDLRRRMLITFDDGYSNFCDQALPLLQRYGFTATLFVPVDYVGRRPTWLENNQAAAQLLLDQLGFSGRDRQLLNESMATLARAPLLGWPELRNLAAAGIDVQSHGAGHGFLTQQHPEEIAADLMRSRTVLEDRLGKPISTIAYPYGACNSLTARLAQQAGFRAGFISDFGPRDRAGLMRWRAGISARITPAELHAMMVSWPIYPRLRCLARRVEVGRPA